MAVFVVRTERRPGLVRHVVRYQAGRYAPQVHLGSFKTTTEANLRREWAERELAAGRVPDPSRIGVVERPRLVADVVAEWLDARRANTMESTHESLTYRAAPVVKIVGHLPVSDVTPVVVQAMILELLDHGATGKKGEARRTVRGRVSVLRQVLDHAQVEPNPVDAKMVKKPPNTGKRIAVPTLAEEAVILPALTIENRRVVEWIRATGMRISEATNLTWGDVHHESTSVRVLESKTDAGERWIQSEPEAPFELPERPDGAEDWRRVFSVSSSGAVRAAISRACADTGTRRLGPHAWRHLHASMCLRNGMDVVRVAARLGHANPTVTLGTYAHLVEPRHLLPPR